MSGIVCIYGTCDSKALEEALKRLNHRGPNNRRIIITEEALMGYTSFEEATGKSQAFYQDGQGVALFDGFLYDDALYPPPQVILDLFRKEGPGFLNMLDGIFALIINNGRDFLAARDPFGLKPLYYGKRKGNLVFASELKALTPLCSEVNIFPPGTYFQPEKGFVRYFDFEREILGFPSPVNLEEAAERLYFLLTMSVIKRLKVLGGKPAIFLSGGLDSSCVAAVTSKQVTGLKTFSVGYQGSLDLQHARQVAAYLGSSHYEYQYSEKEMMEVLPQVIYHLESFDAPLVRGSVANFLVARLARQHQADYVFMGEGSDELFGGYHYLKKKNKVDAARELEKLTCNGYNIGFQRVDRMTAANLLQCDMPFMDKEVVRFAFSLPLEWKIHENDRKIEKWILRWAFEKQLPENIVWRNKDEFSVGAGSAEVIKEMANREISDTEFARDRYLVKDFILSSKEELFYYKIFKEFFPDRSVLATIGRWQPE